MKTNLRIGEVLMERGYITSDQMDKALAYQKEHRDKRVGQILIELGFVTESQVLEALAQRLGLDIVAIGSPTTTPRSAHERPQTRQISVRRTPRPSMCSLRRAKTATWKRQSSSS